jgi:hypothetical protein
MAKTTSAADLVLAMTVIFVFSGAHCSAPAPDDTIIPVPGADCVVACNHLAANHCEEGEKTAAGTPCTEVCANGMAARYDLACVAGIPACDLEPCSRDAESSR